ncbi:hypothetical protein IW262DRAFT_354606 [Armillaria fumosa]|nr:hypothetical protein IW262DRAFT_354606 [Armillaria fumosa]
MAMSVPFKTTAFNLVMRNWTDKLPRVVVVVCLLIAYKMLASYRNCPPYPRALYAHLGPFQRTCSELKLVQVRVGVGFYGPYRPTVVIAAGSTSPGNLSHSPPSELTMFRTRVGGDDFWRGAEGVTLLFQYCVLPTRDVLHCWCFHRRNDCHLHRSKVGFGLVWETHWHHGFALYYCYGEFGRLGLGLFGRCPDNAVHFSAQN